MERRRGRLWLGPVGTIVLLLLIVGTVFYLIRIGGEGGAPAGEQISYEWTIRGLDGEPLPMTRTRGRVLFLNFWATWCPPCRAEMPSIQNLYDGLRGENIAFVLVSNEDAAKLRDFVEDNGYTMPVYTGARAAPRSLRPRAIPTTYIVDSGGRIVDRHTGARQWDAPEVMDRLKRLARESAGASHAGEDSRP